MNGTRALLVVLLVLSSGAGALGTVSVNVSARGTHTMTDIEATSAATSPSVAGVPLADQACRGIEETSLVATYESGDRLESGTAVYPGTHLFLFVCSNQDPEPYGSAWGFAKGSGYAIDGPQDDHLVVTVTPVDGPVELAGQVTRKDELPGLTYRVVMGYAATSTFTEDTFQFSSAAERAEFRTAERAFETNLEAIHTASVLVNESRSAADGSLPPFPADGLETLSNAALRDHQQAVGDAAFPAAATGSVAEVQRLLTQVEDDRIEAESTARASLTAYREDLTEIRTRKANEVRLFAAVSLVVSLIAGIGLGFVLARRRLSRVEYDRAVSRKSTYGFKQIRLPVVAGAFIALVGIGGAVVLGGIGLFGVIT